MVRLATLLLGSQHLAEEVVQDCFLRLQPRFDTVDDPAGYLHRSVVNGCRSLMRRQRRERDHLRATPGRQAELGAPSSLTSPPPPPSPSRTPSSRRSLP